jgi:hypothetical protein
VVTSVLSPRTTEKPLRRRPARNAHPPLEVTLTRALEYNTVAPQTCDALALLPAHIITRIDGDHVLACISEDWYCLVGPDTESGDEIEAAAGMLAGEWRAVFESFGDVLLTHFSRV